MNRIYIFFSCIYLLLFCSFASKCQERIVLDSSQQEIVAEIETVMQLSEQGLKNESDLSLTLKVIEIVQSITGLSEYDPQQTIALASMLTIEDNHIIVLPKYQEEAKGATWDGVSLFDLAKALDEYRTNSLTP